MPHFFFFISTTFFQNHLFKAFFFMLKCPAFFFGPSDPPMEFFLPKMFIPQIYWDVGKYWISNPFLPIIGPSRSAQISSQKLWIFMFLWDFWQFSLWGQVYARGCLCGKGRGFNRKLFSRAAQFFHSLSLTPGVGWELMPWWSLSVMIDLGGWRAWRHGGWIWAWEKCPQGERKLNL